MIELGIDTGSLSERGRFAEGLLERFAFSVPDQFDPADSYESELRTFFADRYGGPTGAIHGGSGRCGTSGYFHAKGMGRTPLISSRADWFHSHGCMWLEEAIRETIYSELACAEFPHSAIPVIAIIDCGLHIYSDSEPPGARRAMIVRPNFIRLAHLERSIYFGTAGSVRSNQYLDALRTKEVIQSFVNRASEGSRGVFLTRNIEETFSRIGEQIGYGWASRLFHGGYLSSNITINGELLDFGSFRALPNWRRAYTAPNQPAFGDDIQMVLASAHSIAFYFSRYVPSASSSQLRRELQAVTQQSATAQFDKELGALVAPIAVQCGVLADRVKAALAELFSEQQADPVNYLSGEQTVRFPWVTNTRGWERTSESLGKGRVLDRIDLLMTEVEQLRGMGPLVRQCLMRTLKPRRLLFREHLLQLTESLISRGRYKAPDFPNQLCVYIDSLVAAGRRAWRVANPQHLTTIRHYDSLCSVLTCTNPLEGRSYLRIDATASKEKIFLPGGPVSRKTIEARVPVQECGNGRVTYDTLPVGDSLVGSVSRRNAE